MKHDLSVIILNWNGENFLKQFLPGVIKYSSIPGVKIVVADNASSDNSVKWLKSNYSDEIEILEFEKNLGFSGGYNEAFRLIDTEFICLLNSDVEIKAPWIEPVLKYLRENDNVAAVSSKLKDQINPDFLEYASAAGGFIDKYGYPFCRGRIFETVEKDNDQYNETMEILWGAGAALFVKRKVWLEEGGLDEDFFAHMEEIDLCWRIRNKGKKVVSIPESVVYHVGGGTLPKNNPRKTFLNFRNNLWMLQKNLPDGKIKRIIFIRFWLDVLAAFMFFFSGRFKDSGAVFKAWINVLKTRKYTLSKRDKDKNRIHTRSTGFYNKSILWQYHIKKKKTFSQLNLD